MNIEPLSKDIYNKAKSLGIEQIILSFAGGSDEGYLAVSVIPHNQEAKLSEEIEEWAWSVYHYSGAGDGADYGDDITYNLKSGEVSHSEWYHAPQHIEHGSTKLEIAEE